MMIIILSIERCGPDGIRDVGVESSGRFRHLPKSAEIRFLNIRKGANFAREALARGARKVYAAARDPSRVSLAGVVPVRLDVTKEDEIAAAAAQCADVYIPA